MAVTLSAILPTHERPASLRRCVESLLAQTRPPDELIVVNDGTDELQADLLVLLEATGWPLMVIRRSEASSTASRNAGLQAARCDVAVLLEDDLVLPATYLDTLASLYEADADHLIGGIAPCIREPDTEGLTGRAWVCISRLLGRGSWGPRHVASRYTVLPPTLAGRLVPARKLSAGGLSLRREVARRFEFDEMLSGYAWGEDRELTFRISPHYPLYRARELVVLHHREPGGRGNWRARGQACVSNTLHIARRVDGGVGMWVLVAWDLAGTALQYAAWLPMSPTRRAKGAFLRGMMDELWSRARQGLRRCLCG